MSTLLLKQSSIYSLNHLFVTLSGLITFPLLTKNLSVVEYGAAGLFTITIGMLSSLNKFGIQQSIIRFKPDVDNDNLLSSIFYPGLLLVLMSSIFIYCLGLVLSTISVSILFTSPAMEIIVLSSALQSIRALIMNVLISDQKSMLVTFFSLIYRILTLSTVAIIILYISKTSIGFIYSILISDIVITFIMLGVCFKNNILIPFSKGSFNKGIFFGALAFSIPMFGNEISHMLHAFIDRYFIEYYISKEALGIYSASYNMANIICNTLIGGLAIAIVPVYLNVWKNEGLEATQKLLSDVNSAYLLLAPGVIAGLYLVSKPLLIVLATREYAEFSYLLPLISIGLILFSANIIYAAGLQIIKKPKKMLQFVLESMLINIILNYLFIPSYGIDAAAIITIVSYLWMTVRMFFEGRKVVRVYFDFLLLLRSTIYASLMIIVGSLIQFNSPLVNLLVTILVGGGTYVLLILLLEVSVRKTIFILIRK